jgi:hypothetical protein
VAIPTPLRSEVLIEVLAAVFKGEVCDGLRTALSS